MIQRARPNYDGVIREIALHVREPSPIRIYGVVPGGKYHEGSLLAVEERERPTEPLVKIPNHLMMAGTIRMGYAVN
ncbi:hypothetical protein BH23GEM7_BH23GEM7_40240 [soil metagenome]